MGSNGGVDHLSKEIVEEGLSSQEMDMGFQQIGGGGVDESVVEKETPDEQLNAGYLEEPKDKKNSMRQSVLEISHSKEMNVCSSPPRGSCLVTFSFGSFGYLTTVRVSLLT